VKNAQFPFKILCSQGMVVQLFQVDKVRKALFGWPEKDNSIVLRECYEWSEKHGFDQIHTYWKTYFKIDLSEVIDKRKPGEPIFLKINKEGDIISP